ncbi:MAG: hypothetical protein INR62_07065, partial [Rhodospirillales bacterium]|nr:hypothetical protein [Acetobacter sp.]
EAEQARNDRLDRAERNRRNAENSCGPRTPEGKNVSKLNAVKTALTGRTVLLPTDEVAHYERHVQNWFADFEPQTPREEYLTQSIADTEWRLERIVQIESSFYAMGRVRFEADLRNDMADDVPDALIPSLLDAHVQMFYEKQFRNLSLQETRLRRQRDRDEAKLRQLQKERQEKEKDEKRQNALQAAAEAYANHAGPDEAFQAPKSGFVFSIAEMKRYRRTTNSRPATQSTDKEHQPTAA